MRRFSVLAIMVLALGFSASLTAEQIVSPNDPEKTVDVTLQPGGATISCIADLIVTDFTCGNGLGPYTTEFQNINSPNDYEYYRGTCNPGDNVVIEVFRLTDDMDPAVHACEGDFCGMGNAGWSSFTCPPGTNLLGSADDNNGIPCGVGGGFADPSFQFVCPPGGVFTIAVYDFIGDGPTPEFEIHASGVMAPAPTMKPLALVALTLLMLMAAALVFRRL